MFKSRHHIHHISNVLLNLISTSLGCAIDSTCMKAISDIQPATMTQFKL